MSLDNQTLFTFSFDPSQFHEVTLEADGAVGWARIHDEVGHSVCDIDLVVGGKPPSTDICQRCGIPKAPHTDQPSVRRTCADCGATQYHISQSATDGPEGRKGEVLLVPASIFLHNMRFVDGGSFTRLGVDWLARQLFGLTATKNIEAMLGFLQCWKVHADNVLRDDPMGHLLSSEAPDAVARATDFITKNPETNTLAALILSTKTEVLRNALGSADETARALALDAFSASAALSVMAFRFAAAEACLRGNAIEGLRWLFSHCNKE